MSTQNRPVTKSFRRTSSTLIALLATLFLVLAPSAFARPADNGPSLDASIVMEWVQDLLAELGTVFAKSESQGETAAPTNPLDPVDPDDEEPVTEGGPVLEPFG